jgi:hypothetical protein
MPPSLVTSWARSFNRFMISVLQALGDCEYASRLFRKAGDSTLDLDPKTLAEQRVEPAEDAGGV